MTITILLPYVYAFFSSSTYSYQMSMYDEARRAWKTFDTPLDDGGNERIVIYPCF
jgi:hypothetical protein